jgi:alanine-glyoxylate transaminase/serine-glyoxylate transaminase/serine-pyruvate transaminase
MSAQEKSRPAMNRTLLMIPGPVEVADAVNEASARPPLSHTDPEFIAAMGQCLSMMRKVFDSGPGAQPFLLAGSGTLAMDCAISNVVAPGGRVLVVQSGHFSDRIADMIRSRGAEVHLMESEPGETPDPEKVDQALSADHTITAMTITHVDTSTGVRSDVQELLRIGANRGVISVVDAVCATAGERLPMFEWGAGVVLTASQKAIAAPPGLALMMVAPWAMDARRKFSVAPPLYFDWLSWEPVMTAYEQGSFHYFGTPATGLVLALRAALLECLDLSARTEGPMERSLRGHARAAAAIRAGLEAMGLSLLPKSEVLLANTLTAAYFPSGVDARLLQAVASRGVVLAKGLHPKVKDVTFRIGHMGPVVCQDSLLLRTIDALAHGFNDVGHATAVDAALNATAEVLDRP